MIKNTNTKLQQRANAVLRFEGSAHNVMKWFVVHSNDQFALPPGTIISSLSCLFQDAMTGRNKNIKCTVVGNRLHLEGDFIKKTSWGRNQWRPA